MYPDLKTKQNVIMTQDNKEPSPSWKAKICAVSQGMRHVP